MRVRDQRAAADRLDDMAVHFTMREHGADDIAVAMRAKQRAVPGAPLRCRPECRHAAGVSLDIVQATRLAVTSHQCSSIARVSSSGMSGLAVSAAVQPLYRSTSCWDCLLAMLPLHIWTKMFRFD